MIVINKFCRCRSNSSKCLINYVSTTVTSRCEKPKDEINKTEKKDVQKDKMKKNIQKAASKKLFHLFEDNVSEEERNKAVKKLQTLKMSDAPVTKTVEITQKAQKNKETRPVDEAAKKAKSRLEYVLVKSVKKVADEFGGNVNKTDTELLNSLSKVLDNFSLDPKSQRKKKISKEGETDQSNVRPKNLSQIDPKSQQKERISENDTHQSHVKAKDVKVDGRMPKETERLKEILLDINKVEIPKEEPMKEFSHPIMLSELLGKSGSLNIFHPDLERNEGTKLKIWDELERDELKYLVTSAPRNYYQELIKWTEEGKLWHFPINNEQGMDEEASVDFTEHVFLEDHLEVWCPKSGPLRHFMELVCVGLSKNPYLTVEDKQEHINWFRDYFEEKKRILQELGALAGRKELEEGKETEAKQ